MEKNWEFYLFRSCAVPQHFLRSITLHLGVLVWVLPTYRASSMPAQSRHTERCIYRWRWYMYRLIGREIES